MQKGNRLGFFTNPERQNAIECLNYALFKAKKLGYSCCVNSEIRNRVSAAAPTFEEAAPDMIIAFGGDGTILHAAVPAYTYGVPILGVNLGRIGFLSEVPPGEVDDALIRIERDEYTLDPRMMLSCSVNGGENRLCLNEALLYKRSFSGVVDISMEIDGKNAGSVLCDGIIISTSTGATGYSISAGGPVVAPGLDVIIITPICPHTLSVRPIIASGDAQTRFSMNSEGYVSLDGIYTSQISKADEISIKRSDRHVDFVRFGDHNLYQLIRKRLS